ncbi:MAG: serine/threonine protein kinase [Planctomycetaceae bacterium]
MATSESNRAAAPADALGETKIPGSPSNLADTNVAAPPKSPVAEETTKATAKPPSSGEVPTGEKKQPKKVTQLGDFKLEKKLGQGGMGTVFLATQLSLDRKVALKTLSPEFAKKPDFVQRFLREARSMAKLHHPNVVQVYAADSVSGVHYAAIEFIDGQSMQKWMDQLKKLSVGDALFVTLVCAEALHHAHELNMIHRDIKPDNILVTARGVVKVADFGLAKALDEDVSMTQSGTGLGTPLYMAPEQARNAKHVDKRTDIYALGSTLYYFLTGKLPFTGETTLELIIAKEKGQYPSARKINADVPDRLDLMIGKMLAKDPKHRYADCAEVIRDLQGLGLANASLSFIAGAQASVVGVGSTVSRAPATKLPVAATRATTSAEDAAKTEAKMQLGAAAQSTKTWFVRHNGPDGKMTVTKMSTGEIMAGIKAETLDINAKAKDSPNGSFLPLAQFREFDSLVQKRTVKAEAEAKSQKTRKLYDKLDRQEARRRRWRFLGRWISNVRDLINFVIYLAVLAGIGYGIWVYGIPFIQQTLKK